MTIFISFSYISLEDTINHLNTIKINSYPLDNVAYLCDEILVDVEHIMSAGAFKPENLGYITQFLRILLTEYFDFKSFIITSRLCNLSINFLCEICITYNHSISSLMSSLYNRLCVNTESLSIKSYGHLMK